MKHKDLSRRNFIKTTTAATAGAFLTPVVACSSSPYDSKGLHTKILGKTGVRIPPLVFGTGSRFMTATEDDGLALLEFALDNGLYYWDTAAIYKNENEFSEERLGKILKSRRSEVFLATKVGERNADDAKKTIETSLKRLQTDYIDLFQIHSVTNEEEVRRFGDKDGVLPVLKKFQEEGVIKYIGFTGHTDASAMKLAAEMYDFDTMLIALNHQQQGKEPFEEEPIPFAAQKGLGIIGMKVIRPRETVTDLNPDDLVKYALSLKGVTVPIIGMETKEVMQKNIDIIKNFKEPFSDEKMKELQVKLDPYFKNKKLPWLQPGYYDGMHWG